MSREPSPTYDPRVRDILNLIGQLSAGDWQARAAVSDRGDELAAILAGLNGLGDAAAVAFDASREERDALAGHVAERLTELERVNAQLKASLRVLEQQNREISVLSQMGDMLQSSISITEAYAIVAQFAGQLFPSAAGALHIYSASRNVLEEMAHWGAATSVDPVFAPEDCWALRRGHIYVVAKQDESLRCRHVSQSCAQGASLCIPMSAHGEILGLVHVCLGAEADEPDWTAYLDGKQRLATTLVEHISLAIANLNLRETMRSLSIRDPLTGLFNRRYLEESLEREMRRAERSQGGLGLLMLDIDHFKQFNDTYGHGAGDMLLHELGLLLKTHVRGSDLACRYGGEEFALLMSETSLAAARERAEELRAELKHLAVIYQGQALGVVTISVGVAIYPTHGDSGENLVRAADTALYRAKREGRDRVVVAG